MPSILLTPGPLTTAAATRRAMDRDWGSRDTDFIALTARVRERLRRIAGADERYAAVPLQGSGTFAVEAAINTLVPRDVMVKDAAPPGQVGKVFGFVSSGLPLGQALTPVPFGFLIDAGRPDLVLALVAGLLLLSLFFMGGARATARREPIPAPAE